MQQSQTAKQVRPEMPYAFMFKTVSDYISTIYEDARERGTTFMLMEFELTHGKKAVVAMYGFLRYARRTLGIEEKRIRETIKHDINGRKDKLMQPKTATYYEFCND